MIAGGSGKTDCLRREARHAFVGNQTGFQALHDDVRTQDCILEFVFVGAGHACPLQGGAALMFAKTIQVLGKRGGAAGFPHDHAHRRRHVAGGEVAVLIHAG